MKFPFSIEVLFVEDVSKASYATNVYGAYTTLSALALQRILGNSTLLTCLDFHSRALIPLCLTYLLTTFPRVLWEEGLASTTSVK